MTNIALPYVSIALDSFALLVILIVFASCFQEFSGKRRKNKQFLFLLLSVTVAIVADIISWIGEGNLSLLYMTVTANTVASCAGKFAIIFFLGYLRYNLYERSKLARVTVILLNILGGLSIAFSLGNAFFGYAFYVDGHGHWHNSSNILMGVLHLLFPTVALLSTVIMALFAKGSAKINRMAFLLYALFPAAGVIVDYTVHGLSMTYVGLAVSILIIYTSIYIKKQKLIEAQKNALMISQINPHFVYNTLSTIASMCDVSPKQAKNLTIDFSRYLRRNLGTLSGEELIPLEQELEHVECYLKIEKARFRERLNVIYSVQCKDFRIPPLSIQPIVENAVKHGITKKTEGGTVKISTYCTDKYNVVEIIDDGIGFDTAALTDAGDHIGLENVKNRVSSLCRGNVNVKSTQGVGTRVTIEIPKKKGKKA